jgi:hypothetical protein
MVVNFVDATPDAFPERFSYFPSSIHRAVVGNDDSQRRMGLLQNPVYGFGQVLIAVENENKAANEGVRNSSLYT